MWPVRDPRASRATDDLTFEQVERDNAREARAFASMSWRTLVLYAVVVLALTAAACLVVLWVVERLTT